MTIIDADFSQAQWQALQGDATAMAAILRDDGRTLDSNEREVECPELVLHDSTATAKFKSSSI